MSGTPRSHSLTLSLSLSRARASVGPGPSFSHAPISSSSSSIAIVLRVCREQPEAGRPAEWLTFAWKLEFSRPPYRLRSGLTHDGAALRGSRLGRRGEPPARIRGEEDETSCGACVVERHRVSRDGGDEVIPSVSGATRI